MNHVSPAQISGLCVHILGLNGKNPNTTCGKNSEHVQKTA